MIKKEKMSHGGGGQKRCYVLFEWPLVESNISIRSAIAKKKGLHVVFVISPFGLNTVLSCIFKNTETGGRVFRDEPCHGFS